MEFLKILFFFLIFTVSLHSKTLNLMTEIFPPYQYKSNIDNSLIGISIEIIRAIQKELGTKDNIKVYPWSRGIKMLQKKKNTALFSMLRTKEREKKFKWVGPLTKMQLVFFKKRGSSIVLNSLEDAKKISKIGVTRNVANYDILTEKGFENLDIIKSGVDEQNIQKLVKGRIDLWLALKKSGLYNAKEMGCGGQITPIENIIVFEGDLYIAFNKDTKDSVINRWQNALDKIRKNRLITKIQARY